MEGRSLELGDLEAADVAPLPAGDFSWRKQWYPLVVDELTDGTRPTAATLLGESLVLWKDGTGAWCCFEDRCPHRSAPLSEGKVWADGTLMCSYHGWRFNSDGACVKIPQASSPGAEQTACASQRSCAVSRPVKLAQGLVFVWGEAGPEAAEESERTPVPIDPLLAAAEARGEEVQYAVPPYFRDLPYDWATLVENCVDPAHVPFAHHGARPILATGSREKVMHGQWELKAVPQEPPSGKTTQLEVQYTAALGPGRLHFQPPGKIGHTTERADGSYTSFCIYATPTSPGACRILMHFTTTRSQPLPFRLAMKLPAWYKHTKLRHVVLDGDNVFLHFQDHVLARARAEGKSWRALYYLPTRADTMVSAFRNWVDNLGGGGPFGQLPTATNIPPLVADHRVLLDRYEQHTKNCTACLAALARIRALRAAAAVAAALAWGVALVLGLQWRWGAAAVASPPLGLLAAAAAVGAVLTAAWRALGSVVQSFYFVDYDHQAK